MADTAKQYHSKLQTVTVDMRVELDRLKELLTEDAPSAALINGQVSKIYPMVKDMVSYAAALASEQDLL